VQQCIDENVISSLLPQEKILAHSNPRLTASAGVLAAFLLLGGSAAVAVADPGGSHSDRGSSSDRGNGRGNANGNGNANSTGKGNGRGHGNGNGNGDGNGDRASDRANATRVGNGNANSGKRSEGSNGNGSASKDSVESPTVQIGSGRVDVADIIELVPGLVAGSGDSGASQPPSPQSVAIASGGVGIAGTPGQSGVDRAGAPNVQFSPPLVTVGNGRTPSIQKSEPTPQWRAPAIQPAPVAPPPPSPPSVAAPSSSLMDRLSRPPALAQHLGVAQPNDWTNALWGLAGLLLIPAAGAVLGYRQARAAQAMNGLSRS
jgi:hypothetical protein